MTVQDFFDKYDNKKTFSEYELRHLFDGDFDDDINDTIHLIETQYDENRRWSRYVSHYYQINDRYFCFYCDEGLTEMQESSYWDQPVEVRPHTYQKTITVTEWEYINKDA